MVGKRGWLRIVEASIAILIIFGVLLSVSNRQVLSGQQELTSLITPLLEEIAVNNTIREMIISESPDAESEINKFISERIKQSSIKYQTVICESDEICSLSAYPSDASEVYASERVISSTLEEFRPKKVKIFLWRATA